MPNCRTRALLGKAQEGLLHQIGRQLPVAQPLGQIALQFASMREKELLEFPTRQGGTPRIFQY
jgi:hypothetical protein